MEILKVENLSFSYPGGKNHALEDINLMVNQGEFVLLCGKSGCGKTTLLRLLKTAIAPFGDLSGAVYFKGLPLSDVEMRVQAGEIGFVMQNPDNQVVTDKVWHELAFGLESLGYSTPEIRTRVSEMASFFGIQNWFYKNVTELSGGEKQLLNLASVMVMQPSLLILVEPTSQLDPITAGELLKALEKINRELGITVILSEHRLEEAFPLADRVVVMDEGRIIADSVPAEVGKTLKSQNHDMYKALPTPVKVHGCVENSLPCPLTVREGRAWLEEYAKDNVLNTDIIPKDKACNNTNTVIELRDVWFRYGKDLPDVLKGLTVEINQGELFCLVGGNGTGKTTALSVISGLNTPYRGDVWVSGQSVSKIKNLYNGLLAVLPQDPQSLFVKKTVYLDLMEMLSDEKLSKEEKEERVKCVSVICRVESLLASHPYDLSGGEHQRAALAKVLLKSPKILLLDEPTKGMDAHFKEEFAGILLDLKANGVTVVMVSHDIEFCAEYADRCALVFDGSITSIGRPREFFCGKSFYTTSANRMARTTVPEALLGEDIILALGGKYEKRKCFTQSVAFKKNEKQPAAEKKSAARPSTARIVIGSMLSLLFVAMTIISYMGLYPLQMFLIPVFATICLCLFPQKEIGVERGTPPKADRKLAKRTLTATGMILLLIPLTIYTGSVLLGERKYYFISLLIILETMIPFCMVFESRKPKARELVVISVLCAIAVAGRAAFFMLPQFKPVIALVIVAAICFGGETGFLVGAVSGFVSNFIFGQGPWAPWQMFAFGIIGFIAGILFRKGFLPKTKISLCIFGFFSTLIIYGGIMNPASVIMWQNNITKEMILSSYIVGLPFDAIHASATAFFLWFISEPMIDKLERIKVKYGLIER